MLVAVKANEAYVLENEVWFDGHRFGSNTGIPSGQIKIRRDTDNLFWDGATFDVTEAYLPTTISVDGLTHSYAFTFPPGNDIAYTMWIRVNDDTDTERIGNFITRDMSGGGGGGSWTKVFDGVDFATGFPSTVG